MGTSSDMSTSNGYIKYHITIDQGAQSVENNNTNVTVSVDFWRTNSGYSTYGSGTVYCKIDGTTYSASVSASQKITSSGITLFSKNLDISHNSDGTKTLDTSAWISLDTPLSSDEQGYSQTLTTIPRASSVSGGSGNIGSSTTININRMSSNFVHSLYWVYGSSGWQTIATNVGTSYNWTIPTSFYSLIPNSNSGTGTIYCETYNSGTYIGVSSTSFTFNVTNSNPVFNASQLTYQDTNSTVTAITGNNQQIVRNQSTLQAVYTAATAQNSASISKYQITFNGQTQEQSGAATINYGTVDSSSNLTLSVKAIDSRGNSTTIPKTITMLDWALPTAVITANRLNNYEATTYLKADTTISSVGSKNSLQELKFRNKKTSDTSYSAYANLTSGTQITLTIDNLYAWDFQVVVTDKFGSTTYNFTVAKGKPIMFFDTNLLSIGINKLPASTGTLEVGGNLVLSGNLSITNSLNTLINMGLTDVNTTDFSATGQSNWLSQVQSYVVANLPYRKAWIFNAGYAGVGYGTAIAWSTSNLKFLMVFNETIGVRFYKYLPSTWKEVSATGATVLYSNTSGTNGTITLSETAANFSYLEIYFVPDSNILTMTKVYNPNGKGASLSATNYYQGYIYVKGTYLAISGTSVTWSYTGWLYGTGGSSLTVNSNFSMSVTQIIGYR